MERNKIVVIFALIVLTGMIVPVSADISVSYASYDASSDYSGFVQCLMFNNITYVNPYSVQDVSTYWTTGSGTSGSAPVTFWVGSPGSPTSIGTGTIGYTNTGGTTTAYVYFDPGFDVSSLAYYSAGGYYFCNMTYNTALIPTLKMSRAVGTSTATSGKPVVFGGYSSSGRRGLATYTTSPTMTFTFQKAWPFTLSFVCAPLSGVKPVTTDCTITSNYFPTIQTWDWGNGWIDNYTAATTPYASNIYTDAGLYTVSLQGYNVTGGWVNQTRTNYIDVSDTSGIGLTIKAHDVAIPSAVIIGATISVQNTTSLEWNNETTVIGERTLYSIDSIGLSQGQTVQICADANGYDEVCHTLLIPYDAYTDHIYLTKTGQAATLGNWNLNVKVEKNLDKTPIAGATVEVYTGVNNNVPFSAGTDKNGAASFMNISASASAGLRVVKQGYQEGSQVITVVPNSTQSVTIQLVAIGQTPVTTPVSPTPTQTGGPGAVVTTVPYPVPTDPVTGDPITDPVKKGYAAWNLLIDAAYAIVGLTVGIIFIWLLWQTVWQITGGSVIGKMLKRGRR